MSNLKDPSSYIFFLSFEGELKDKKVAKAIEKLKEFTSKIVVLGEY